MNRGSRAHRAVRSDVLEFDPAIVRGLSAQTEQALFADLPDGGRMILRALRQAWQQELTPIQKKYLVLYYEKNMTMREIAGRYGVATPTVSRTIRRGRERLRRVLQYYL